MYICFQFRSMFFGTSQASSAVSQETQRDIGVLVEDTDEEDDWMKPHISLHVNIALSMSSWLQKNNIRNISTANINLLMFKCKLVLFCNVQIVNILYSCFFFMNKTCQTTSICLIIQLYSFYYFPWRNDAFLNLKTLYPV